ncbi:MAG: DHH family phosphoesterase, partial [Armatimonadota bacterium]
MPATETAARDAAVLAEIATAVAGAESIFIAAHENPDGDAVGSLLALRSILVDLGKRVHAATPNSPPERFAFLDGIDAIAAIPLAYGLPRGEGFGLPYAVPELDGELLYEHDRLPSVDGSNLIPDELTIRSFEDLQSPPDLANRETGYRFDYQDAQDEETDVPYDLRPSADLEHINDFVGPQLSFEFSIPTFAEDAVASHITTAGVPWKDPRYEN